MRALVIGGGIAGLACGHRLAQRDVETLVLEADARPGGKVHTEIAAGCVLESGPQTCIATPELLGLARELGVKTVEPLPGERRRYLVRRGRLVSPLRAIPVLGLLRALWGALRKGPPPGEDETVLAYATRRFGAQAARRFFDPLVSGIFAGDPARLAYASALARFGKRRGGTVTFEGGMAALPRALASALGEGLRLGARVRGIARSRGGGFDVALEDGERLETDALVLACPAASSAGLLRPLDAELADELAAIRYESVTAVSLVYPVAAFAGALPRGFGFLAASEEGLPILGCLFCPSPAGKVVLRPMLRGTPPDAVASARGAVEKLLAINGSPELVRVATHARGIPQYEVGHARRLRAIEERLRALPGVHLAGNAYRGVSVPDVIEDARRIADGIASRSGAARELEDAPTS